MARNLSEQTPDPLYVAARRALLDALVALREHANSFVVVGAQAVYLRTHMLDGSIAPYTTDGDFALDPRGLAATPNLDETLRAAGFEPKRSDDGTDVIGTWTTHAADVGQDIDVDVHVPIAASTGGGTRAARLGPHGDRVARLTSGLEAALVDHAIVSIGALDPADVRRVEAQVAGTAALYVAKVHKLADRLKGDVHRLHDKDAGDVYRLMQVTRPSDMANVLQQLVAAPVAAEVTIRALELGRAQFGGRGTPGTELAVRNLETVIDPDQVRTLCATYTQELVSLAAMSTTVAKHGPD
jgi:hypothetical protein